MTKFDELMDLIGRNKNKDKNSTSLIKNTEDDKDFQLEVAGSDPTRAPLVASADSDLDPDIIDMLYTKNWRNIPLRGENASSWDSDY